MAKANIRPITAQRSVPSIAKPAPRDEFISQPVVPTNGHPMLPAVNHGKGVVTHSNLKSPFFAMPGIMRKAGR